MAAGLAAGLAAAGPTALTPPRMRPAPFDPLRRCCFEYADADDAARTVGAVLGRLGWNVRFLPRVAKWIATKGGPEGAVIGLNVRLYAWPSRERTAGGLVEVVRRFGERPSLGCRDAFDEAFLELRRRCRALPSAL